MSPIWQACEGPNQIHPLQARVIRIVESQEQAATMVLVDNAEEQYVLEQLLDRSKPPQPIGTEAYHYLIWTPFRYPPLPYGSRFGQRTQRGIFYGSLTETTALAECAYYRYVFLAGLSIPLPSERLNTEHTTFEVQVETAYGLNLDATPFDAHSHTISDPLSYAASQLLGVAMRAAGVAAFSYRSARDFQTGINFGALTHTAIKSLQPEQSKQWLCTTTSNKVSFIEVHANKQPHSFSLENYLIQGRLPIPAC